MNIEQVQTEIDKTDYWDMKILNVQADFFGDELTIYIEKDDKTSFKVSFNTCYKVNYETDAGWDDNWRGSVKVKDMSFAQLGYFAQDITVSESENEDFIKVECNFSIMNMSIVCKNIDVEEIQNKDLSFFWEKEK
ncbi:hypothetical protein ACFO26_02965 [Lactococcus nasutitermitis]|uniref:Immunity protein 50 n=1 Tax=Lactococcus nasutitermitis TaxID=1652957 RepID=A0ABV9JAU9_9LACT|nr:hypothetical protein [Lactococcus nasutitermitis]